MLTLNTIDFTPEQIKQIDFYRHKWEEIARSTTAVNREQATLAIKNAYAFIDLPEPNIIFISTPYKALDYLQQEIRANWGKLENTSLEKPIARNVVRKLLGNIKTEITKEILEQLQGDLDNDLANNLAFEALSRFQENQVSYIIMANFRAMIISLDNEPNKAVFRLFFDACYIFLNYISPFLWQIVNLFRKNQQKSSGSALGNLFTGRFGKTQSTQYELPLVDSNSQFVNSLVPSVMADFAYYIDYCHEVLKCDRDPIKWKIFDDLITSCGWIFPYEKTVLVCDR